MGQDGWVVGAFDAVALVVWQDRWVGFQVVGGEDGVCGRRGAVADAVEDFRGHQGAVEEGGAAVIWVGDFRRRLNLAAVGGHVF